VSDVVHLLAELIENATTFSPKDTQVQVTAQEISSGGALIEVIDSGVGIPDDVLAEMNERLDNPPVIDVSVSRHMGLFAVARLAERHGEQPHVRVRLRFRSPQGIIAMVWLPDAILQEGDRPFGRVHPALRQNGIQGRRTAGAGSRSSLLAHAPQPIQQAVPPTPIPAAPPPREPTRSVGVATSKWFTDPRANKGGPTGTNGLVTRPTEEQGFGMRFPATAQAVADPVHGDQTASGLPLRVPLANLIPGSMDATRQAGNGTPGHQADGRETPPPTQGWQPRTPEIARSRLSGFQRGVRRGKSQQTTPRVGEGSDR
jgi:hypothetical protein